MIVNPEIIEELCIDAGDKRTQKARAYVAGGRVDIQKVDYGNENNFEISAIVQGEQNKYRTNIYVSDGEIEDITCDCEDYYSRYGVCKHIIATLMHFSKDKRYENVIKSKETGLKYRSFMQVVNGLYEEQMQELEKQSENKSNYQEKDKISIEPKFIYDKYYNTLKVEFKIGKERLYKLKEISEFYKRFKNREFFKYGNKLEFLHEKEIIKEKHQDLLEFILKNGEIINFVNSSANSNYRYYGKALNDTTIALTETRIDEFFDIMKNQKLIFQAEYKEEKILLLEQNPQIDFTLEKINKDEYKLISNEDFRELQIIYGAQFKYILKDNILYKCDKKFEQTTMKVIKIFRENFLTEVIFSKNQLPELFSIIMPKVKDRINLNNVESKELEEYRPKELGVKVYLDFDEDDYIIADIKFCYGDEEFNPLEEDTKINTPRNILQETESMNMFINTGFLLYQEKSKLILPEEEKIFKFLSEDIEKYMQKFEVLVTDNFKTKQIKQPKIGSIGIKVENNLLSIDLSDLNIETDELEEIMSKYKLKKKYHKLKNGIFLSLEENQDIEFIDKLIGGMDIDYKDLQKGEVKLPINRSIYLNTLLEGIKNTEVTKNKEYKDIIDGTSKEQIEEIEVPKELDKTLRFYQKTGFKWLKTLDNYKFGGILADDMGLGKTIQILSILLAYVEEEKENRKTSIVVCPSSLSLNWQAEVNKFTDKLKALVIHGTARERKEQINKLEEYDLVITSYDLLKRDIEVYKEKDYTFRYIIADEAQYLKNNNTQNAKSIKEIKANTRYALTGTPIENSLAELWSIFDYIMPGYLFSYKKFKTLYESPIVKDNDTKAMEKLKMLIAPFVLRRTKKEVLTELPDKTITVLNNEMREEQNKIYLSYLAQAKEEVADIVKMKGYERSQIQILTALTRLRQICCHPSLFVDGYTEKSGKLEQCMEIVKTGIEAGHKILLFSGYTSMFEIIEKEFKKENIKYFKLTGSTKVADRIDLVDEFNSNEDIKVFLISLKAGGTGLNLIGADMVIHYDPWWNQAAENQATDRAYRIGQKKNVQVYKLITKNSIEEKIYELQNKKSELIDNMLSTKTSFINKLSKEDIMNLFE